MIARWRDQLDRQIIVFVAFYVGNKKIPSKTALKMAQAVYFLLFLDCSPSSRKA